MTNSVPEVSARLCCGKCGRPYETSIEKDGVSLTLKTLRRGDVAISLTDRQYQIVEKLLRSAPTGVHKDHLFFSVWGDETDVQMKTLEVFICQIRRRLWGTGLTIQTIYGMGYRMKIHPMPAHA